MSYSMSLGGMSDDSDKSQTKSAETTPAGNQSVQWEVVAQTMGLLPAQIIAGRLKSEGIPVRAWQEAAGQIHGLTVGPMGTGYVLVPEEFVDQALDILEEDAPDDDYDDYYEEE